MMVQWLLWATYTLRGRVFCPQVDTAYRYRVLTDRTLLEGTEAKLQPFRFKEHQDAI